MRSARDNTPPRRSTRHNTSRTVSCERQTGHNSVLPDSDAKRNLHTRMCNNLHRGLMATNLALDDGLIEQARAVGGHKSKKEAVNAALAEYIQRRKQLKILELFGTNRLRSQLRLQGAASAQTAMMVVVDTSVWSLASAALLVRTYPPATFGILAGSTTGGDARVVLLGMVRQELLSGIKDRQQFRQTARVFAGLSGRSFDRPIMNSRRRCLIRAVPTALPLIQSIS